MRYIYLASAATGLFAAALVTPAQAGDSVLYGAVADWVDVSDLPPAEQDPGMPLRLAETQTRMEDGVVSTYADIAFALDSSEMRDAVSTISLGWMPDKGDLVVHRVELLRDGKTIDLLADGERFEVLRREAMLEQRILDGALTATMKVAGAKIGDVLRYSFTTTTDEQILEDDMEYASSVLSEPAPLAKGRMIVSWPVDEDVRWATSRVDAPVAEQTRDGYKYITIEVPIAELKDMPGDAPPRFRLPPAIRASTFDSYSQISADLAPFFSTEGAIEPGSTLAGKVAEIAAKSNDPLERAALATQFVQDEISYLLDGLNGGNYIPQTPAKTWEVRTGDCKAKSLLLLAMLRELGVSAEAVLVSSRTGDAVPELLPTLGNFDHMIVRADIGGESYWLDGTNGGLRLANIGEVPRFRYALPVREGGADLQEMAMRPQTMPDDDIRLTIDQSAGIDLPAIYEIEWRVSGAAARTYQAVALLDDSDMRTDRIEATIGSLLGSNHPTSVDVTYDEASGIAVVTGRGLVEPTWDRESGRIELDVPYQALSSFSFDVSRDRSDLADIPMTVNGPLYFNRHIEWRLPEEDGEYRLLGGKPVDTVIGGTQLVANPTLADDLFTLDESVRSLVWEVPASDLPQIRRDSLRLKRGLPRIVAPRDARMVWDKRDEIARLTAPIASMYDAVLAREDDAEALVDLHRDRGYFRYQIADFDGALEDYGAAVDGDPSASSYNSRAWVRLQLGDNEGVLSDIEAAAELDPEYGLAEPRLIALGLLGRGDETVALVDEYEVFLEDASVRTQHRAYALGGAGEIDEGRALLEEELEFTPGDADLLNASCWYDGIWDRVTEETIDRCTRAIEGLDNSLEALDSRALALFRLGRNDEALRDLDRVLTIDPEMDGSRYLRGVIRSHSGDAAGAREDIEIVRWASPYTPRQYALWGLEPA